MKRPSSYTNPAVFTREADGRYSVNFPQLDGCCTEGDDFEEARRMAVEAMSLHLYDMEQDGEAIPAADFDIPAERGKLVVPITGWMTPFRDEMESDPIIIPKASLLLVNGVFF